MGHYRSDGEVYSKVRNEGADLVARKTIAKLRQIVNSHPKLLSRLCLLSIAGE